MELSTFVAEPRVVRGKSEIRKLKAKGFVPGVIYGKELKENLLLQLNKKKLTEFLFKLSGHLMKVSLTGGKEQPVIIKEIQTEPVTGELVHIDFSLVGETVPITVDVRLKFNGTAKGVKEGGILQIETRELKVEGLLKDIPTHIDVDVSDIEINHGINVSGLKIPAGIKSLEDPNQRVVSVTVAKEEVEEIKPDLELAEPEVIGAKKEGEEGEAEAADGKKAAPAGDAKKPGEKAAEKAPAGDKKPEGKKKE